MSRTQSVSGGMHPQPFDGEAFDENVDDARIFHESLQLEFACAGANFFQQRGEIGRQAAHDDRS